MPIWNYVFPTDWLRLIINTRTKNRSMWQNLRDISIWDWYNKKR